MREGGIKERNKEKTENYSMEDREKETIDSSPMIRETCVQSQFALYQNVKNGTW